MSHTLGYQPVHRESAEPTPVTENDRHRLIVEQSPARVVRVRIEDRTNGRTLLEWSGALARHLLQSGALPQAAFRRADYDCDKALIRHLTLTGAAAQLAVDQIAELDAAGERPRQERRLRPVRSAGDLSPVEQMKERLDETGRYLPGPHQLVARTLFSRRGEHFSEPEVVCLLSLECPSMRTSLIQACLDDLTTWKVIQRIVIDDENVFYDVDMRPHLHIFDPATRSLIDAPRAGVVSLEASA